MASASSPPRMLALTMGDPAGIGPEIALRAWLRRAEHGARFYVLANPEVLARAAKALDANAPIAAVSPTEADATFDRALPVVPLRAESRASPGVPDPENAPAILESIERAVASVGAGDAHAVVTNPIAKRPLYKAGFRFPGHTEFLADLAAKAGHARAAVMLIWSDKLAVVPVTIHIPLADAPRLLTRELIVETARTVADDMTRRFGLAHPRLALSGLNPHAGEGGAMGREELEVIAPAIEELRSEGLDVVGPLPADTMFHAAARTRYDVALAMYHDQALIPAKTLAFDTGVNVTLGLPFIRTSPDHGVAYDIAGQGKANPSSLIAALKLAERLNP